MFDDVILWPREQARYALDSQVNSFVANREVVIVSGLPAFQIPDNPTWTEDPHDSRAWALYFNSLGWLFAGEEAYKRGQFDDFVVYAKDMILDFMRANPDPAHPAHVMAYHDGANAFRLSTISYLYETYFKPGNAAGTVVTFSAEEQAVFTQGLQNHLDQVQYQLSLDRWTDSNHRFFHAMALSSYATVFGNAEGTPYFEPDAEALLAEGLQKVDGILESIIDFSTGVTREQSFTYHRLDMGLVLEARASIQDHGFVLPHDYSDLLDRMVEFDVLSRRPGTWSSEHVSEVGDTFYGSPVGSFYINMALAQGHGTDLSRYVLSRGVDGVRPQDVMDYSATGYVILRPEYAWENVRDMRVLMDVSDRVGTHSHGHYDNTNVLFSAYGQRILVDSGGPYSYDKISEMGLGKPFRNAYFQTSFAHNVLVVDGESFNADTQVLSIIDRDAFSSVTARHDGYSGLDVTRQLIVLKDGVVLTFDRAENSGSAIHDFVLPWHFDPAAAGLEAGPLVDFSVGTAQVDAAFLASGAAGFELISGQLGDHPQGWVSPGLYAATPAPVLEVSLSAQDAWFVSGFGVSNSVAPQLQMGFERTASGFEGAVLYGDHGWQIAVSDAGGADVRHVGVSSDAVLRLGTSGVDSLRFGTTDDWILAQSGSDRVVSDGGDDRILAGAGDDTVYAGDGEDVLLGGSGADVLRGEGGGDALYGDIGDDLLMGEAGDDVLTGGLGVDRLYGGLGADLFVLDADSLTGRDVIRDFSLAEGDRISVQDVLEGFDPLSDAIADFVRVTENGGNSYLAVDVNGATGGASFVQIARVDGVTGLTDEALLLSNGVLVA